MLENQTTYCGRQFEMSTQIAIGQNWRLKIEPKKTKSNEALQAMKLNYRFLQGFSVDFTYLFFGSPSGETLDCEESGRGLRDGLTPFLRHIFKSFSPCYLPWSYILFVFLG